MHPAPRRWLIVAALFVVTYGASTPLAAYGAFLPVLAETFSLSRGAISKALSVNLLLGGVVGLGVGALADRQGPRVMLVSTIMGCSSCRRFGAALGPATAGFLYDLTGSYAMPFAASPVVVLASWGLFVLGWRGRRA